MKTVGLVLSGCGVYDGSEIHEAVLSAYFLDREGVSVVYIAPDIEQSDVIDHGSGNALSETRRCLTEAARIARGPVQPLSEVSVENLDGVFFPGGFGAAKNLSNYASKGADLAVLPEVERFIKACVAAQVPMGFLCIAPVIAAKCCPGLVCTLGLEQSNLDILDSLGAKARQANVDDVVVDSQYRVFTSPAYMIDASLSDISVGIEKCVKAVCQAIPEPVSA